MQQSPYNHPGLVQDREDDACLWECRGRQPFAGARGALASSLLPAAAGGKRDFTI